MTENRDRLAAELVEIHTHHRAIVAERGLPTPRVPGQSKRSRA